MATASSVVFLDTECTGLRADVHEIWECALIDQFGEEHAWLLPIDLGRADPFALDIGRFHDRHPQGYGDGADLGLHALTPINLFADEFARLTRGVHLVGAIVSFDEERLRRLLLANRQIPAWHYHIVDCEALAVGYLAGQHDIVNGSNVGEKMHPPWDSEELSRALGVEPDRFDRHTALGDARWSKAVWEAVMNG